MDAYDGTEEIEDMPQYQLEFDDLLEKYAGAVAISEPLENWETQDLIKLMDAIDNELQTRGEHVPAPEDRYVNGYEEYEQEIKDDDY